MGLPQWGHVKVAESATGASNSSATETPKAEAIFSRVPIVVLPAIALARPTAEIPIFSANTF